MNPKIALAQQLLKIGSLPSLPDLRELALEGCRHLVNVSGSSLYDIHGAQGVAAFRVDEYRFSDLFSQHAMLAAGSNTRVFDAMDNPGPFLDAFGPEQQMGFLAGVQAVCSALRSYKTTFLFCHYGVGRSPAVALAVMRCAWGWSLPEAIAATQEIRPQAHLSALSVSASAWALRRFQ